ncbi:alpha/beta fold hydrolase [Planomonospora sp. ID67723]|uniref:alpha/beta fold hydrolase n=1 Tax=Planomonospora sp. ID67723 TaxID=2738134 RepID=UPI0018C39381|nr:alpha/beta fold hydrolase [Planomonospora sp. ID67723]MBG0830636.1 alpha/beta fold hydrolase [Planomonospora sp. ID67723]
MRWIPAAAAAVLTAALAACSGGGEAPSATAPGATAPGAPERQGAISWETCADIKRPDGQGPATPDPSLQCGKLAVPLDYAKPGGATIDLALIRVKAAGPGERIGSLLFNFGGPGGSGVDTLAQAAKSFGTLGARYDLVSFDPRGVERSSGVRCGGSEQMDRFTSLDSVPGDAAERAEIERTIEEFADACQETSGKILPHVGTVNAAQDMDRIRQALGDAKLNYFGMSYGTQLGAVYATKFPDRVGRFVLDAPLDPSVSMEERTLVQTAGFQQAYESFLKDCVKDAGQCETGADTTVANKNVDKLLDDLDDRPLTVGDRRLTQGLAVTGIAAALYSELSWPFLDQALGMAMKGDGRGLLALADSYNGRDANGSYSTIMSSFPAVSCVDTAERPDAATLARTEAAALKVSPLFGNGGMGIICSAWPVPGSDEAMKVDATGSAPIVVIATTGDPATPYEWGPKLTEQLKTAVLVTHKGEGHGAYLSGEACVKKTTDAYLLEGKVPAEGTACPR